MADVDRPIDIELELAKRERQVTVDIPVILREFAREMDEEDEWEEAYGDDEC